MFSLADLLIIFGAKYLVVFIIIAALIYFFRQTADKRKEMVIFGLIVLPAVFLIARLAGLLYFNPRPFTVGQFIPLVAHAPDNGFPSDHALISSALAMIIYFFNKKLGAALMLTAALVGLARVLAGVHHVIDIAGSLVISVFIASAVFYYLLPALLKLSFISRFFNQRAP